MKAYVKWCNIVINGALIVFCAMMAFMHWKLQNTFYGITGFPSHNLFFYGTIAAMSVFCFSCGFSVMILFFVIIFDINTVDVFVEVQRGIKGKGGWHEMSAAGWIVAFVLFMARRAYLAIERNYTRK